MNSESAYQAAHFSFLVKRIANNFILGKFDALLDELVIYLFLYKGPGGSHTNLASVSEQSVVVRFDS